DEPTARRLSLFTPHYSPPAPAPHHPLVGLVPASRSAYTAPPCPCLPGHRDRPMSLDPSQPDRLTRASLAAVGCATRYPWLALAACLGLVAVSVHLAVNRLGYQTQRNDLLSPDKPCQKRWQNYLDAFGDDDDMVVVAEGTDHAQMKAALDAVAEK